MLVSVLEAISECISSSMISREKVSECQNMGLAEPPNLALSSTVRGGAGLGFPYSLSGTSTISSQGEE